MNSYKHYLEKNDLGPKILRQLNSMCNTNTYFLRTILIISSHLRPVIWTEVHRVKVVMHVTSLSCMSSPAQSCYLPQQHDESQLSNPFDLVLKNCSTPKPAQRLQVGGHPPHLDSPRHRQWICFFLGSNMLEGQILCFPFKSMSSGL